MVKWLFGFFSDYQVWATFLASLLGFAGIIVTLVIQRNFDRALDKERVEEARVRLIAALSTELIGVREFAQGALNDLSDSDEFLMPKVLPFFIFDGLAQKIDLLSPVQIQSVRHCYAWVREVPARAAALQPPDWQAPEGYVRVPVGRATVVREWYSHLREFADAALRDLGWRAP